MENIYANIRNNYRRIAAVLRKDGVGVVPTDTLYGLVGSAFSKKAVEKIYQLKRRDSKKPLIILISGFGDLELFGIKVDSRLKSFLEKLWPGKVSIILPCPLKKFEYLHRGAKTLAFRLPVSKSLRDFLKKTGPLAAPSANIEGKPPARNIKEAKAYFGGEVDFYIPGGVRDTKPSILIKVLRM